MTETSPAARAGSIRLGPRVEVNRIGFGALRVTGDGQWGYPPDRDEAIRVLRRAVDLGVNFVDTADAYGPEVSELLIAEALAPYPEGLVVATKGGHTRTGPGQWEIDGRPEHLQAACRESLRRLRLDRLPLYQFHRPDPDVAYAESIGALVELRNQGLIDMIGISNVNSEQLRIARSLTDIVSVQNKFNLAVRDSAEILHSCEESGIAFIPWAPTRDTQNNAALSAIAERHAADRRQMVLAWMLAISPATLPIPGTSSLAHLETNVAAATIELQQDEVDELSQAF